MDYEEKVRTAEDIHHLYENVIARTDIKRYRAYTNLDGDSYGWDPYKGTYFSRHGRVWFDNPSYVDESVKIEFSFDDLIEGIS